jgi:hypothetical protein
MNPLNKTAFGSSAASNVAQAEETLRIIARLPAPAGLEDRLHVALKCAPQTANLLSWPAGGDSGRGWTQSNLARRAAAAAIVFVVAGGGWGVYSRVNPAQAPRVIMMPRVGSGGGFSTSNAIRTPQTLTGPVLLHPVAPVQAESHPGSTSAKASPHPGAKLHKSHRIPAQPVVQ